nr:glucuronate isomerase [uncultured Carboxylicivirga sp.]
MIQPFIHKDFLLETETSKKLYHEYSENQPIIDFHCHLNPQFIAEDRQFESLGQIWLEGDHYKWRAMRINGIDEHYCNGQASDKEKFMKYAETVPYTAGNPLYHWTHLELARYFNVTDLLSPVTADKIFESTKAMLQSPDYSTRKLLEMMKVEVVGTTDDPADDLRYHKQIKEEGYHIKVVPTYRADNVIKTEDPIQFKAYVEKLGEVADVAISSLTDLVEALDRRHAYFHELGARASDSGPDRFFFAKYTEEEVNKIFLKLMAGNTIDEEETEKYRCCVMAELAKLNHKRGWTQQFHVGALRNNNTRKFNIMGADTGWDSINNSQNALKMSQFLNLLDTTDQLAKTILYNLNPADNEMMVTMCGNFNDGSTVGKVQYGAAWWFLDQKTGMEKHLLDLSALGLLSRFVGMVTDSRSFLSYPRHEYFRRIVCNHLGKEVEKGMIPNDDAILKQMVEGISYKNAKSYFNF